MSQVITCDSSRKWHILAPLTPFLSHPSTCDTPSVICTSLWHGSLNMLRLYTVIYWRGYFTGDITKNIEQDISLKPSQNTLHTISNYISNARWCSCNDTATKTCTFSWASPKVQLETYVTVLGYSLTNLVTLATFVMHQGTVWPNVSPCQGTSEYLVIYWQHHRHFLGSMSGSKLCTDSEDLLNHVSEIGVWRAATFKCQMANKCLALPWPTELKVTKCWEIKEWFLFS